MSAKSTSDSTSRRGFATNVRSQPRSRARPGAALDVGEEARELHEQREREQHADQRDPRVVEHRVGEARRAERGRDQREQDDGALLGEPVVDEPVRGVVAAALVDRAGPRAGARRDERRVEDRHGEHEDRQQQRRDRRPGDLPARRQPERGEREAEHLAARVAHEDSRAAGRGAG